MLAIVFGTFARLARSLSSESQTVTVVTLPVLRFMSNTLSAWRASRYADARAGSRPRIWSICSGV